MMMSTFWMTNESPSVAITMTILGRPAKRSISPRFMAIPARPPATVAPSAASGMLPVSWRASYAP